MLTALLLVLFQAAATNQTPVPTVEPTAVPTPAAKLSGGFGQKAAGPGKAKLVVTDHNLAPAGTGGGSFSVAGAPIAAPLLMPVVGTSSQERAAAQKRMDAARQDAAWNGANIRYNWRIVQEGIQEWDAAAENCRKTPGCVPNYRK